VDFSFPGTKVQKNEKAWIRHKPVSVVTTQLGDGHGQAVSRYSEHDM